MTRKEIKEFAEGYKTPIEWVAALLHQYNYNKNKVHEILCKSNEEIRDEVQKAYTAELWINNP